VAAPASAAAGRVAVMFELNKAEMSPAASDALKALAASVKAGGTSKFVVSGYHDTTGDPAKNAELAKQRAFAVRDVLKAAGVTEDRIELKKPEVMNAGAGDDARRVDVTLM
jgi:K(+)-stimulated pyrophosphate-energized sodium pump